MVGWLSAVVRSLAPTPPARLLVGPYKTILPGPPDSPSASAHHLGFNFTHPLTPSTPSAPVASRTLPLLTGHIPEARAFNPLPSLPLAPPPPRLSPFPPPPTRSLPDTRILSLMAIGTQEQQQQQAPTQPPRPSSPPAIGGRRKVVPSKQPSQPQPPSQPVAASNSIPVQSQQPASVSVQSCPGAPSLVLTQRFFRVSALKETIHVHF
jgi:hypothetical protein